MENNKATTLNNFIKFMNYGGWNRESARIIFGERGGDIFSRWAHYTKYMIVDAANTKLLSTLTAEEQEALLDYADKVAE